MKQLFASLIISSILLGCTDNRSGCDFTNVYPEIDLAELQTSEPTVQEGVFQLIDVAGMLINYKTLSGDTIGKSHDFWFENQNTSLNDYIDSLRNIGFVFEMNFNLNHITFDAMEPAVQETPTTWYFVEYKDSNKVVSDLVEAVLDINSNTEAYIAAVSSIDGYDAFWYSNAEIVESSITKEEDDYIIHLSYNESYCDPHQIGEIDILVTNQGQVSIKKDYGITQQIDCKCN